MDAGQPVRSLGSWKPSEVTFFRPPQATEGASKVFIFIARGLYFTTTWNISLMTSSICLVLENPNDGRTLCCTL